MAIKAVGRAAQTVIEDVRKQFRENPGIMEGTSEPDYGRCVHIVTGAALKEMVLLGLLVVATPTLVGIIFRYFSTSFSLDKLADMPMMNGKPINLSGAEAVAGVLMVGTIAGILMALLMNNGGGAWDNAKKLIETGEHGGQRRGAHKAAVGGGTGGPARGMVGVDVLPEGRAPAVDDDEFRRIRADHLTSTDTVAGVGVRARSVRSSGPDARCQPRRHLCAVARLAQHGRRPSRPGGERSLPAHAGRYGLRGD